MRTLRFCLALIAVAMASPALAHVEFRDETVAAGEAFRATLVVGHGCAGSPTLRLRVRIPSGVFVTGVEPKSGWTIDETRGVYDKPLQVGGRTVSGGVMEVRWSGRLDPHDHGAFTLQGELSGALKSGERIVFPVVQECEAGVQRWIDSSEDGESPAPSLLVAPKP